MLPRGQVDFSLGLAGAKMQVVEVVWNRFIQRRQIGIDYQMVVSRIRSIGPRRCYPHTTKPKMNSQLGRHRIAILKVDEIDCGPRRRRCGAAASLGLIVNGSASRNPDQKGKRGRRKYR